MAARRIVFRGSIRWVQYALMLAGTAALAVAAWYYFEATHYQAEYEQAFEQLEAERSPAPSESGTPEPAAPDDAATGGGGRGPATTPSELLDDVVGRLEIPRVHLRVMVLNKADAASLRKGAGWIDPTASPTEPGNMGIAGHRDTHFRALESVRKGDQIVLTTVAGQRNEYRVEWMAVVNPSHTQVLDPTPDTVLTLVTCYPFNYVGHAPKRFIVRAIRTDDKAAALNRERNN